MPYVYMNAAEEVVNVGQKIKRVTIPIQVKSIGDSAFANQDNLESVIFNSVYETQYVAENAFEGCTNLTIIDFPDIELSDDFITKYESCWGAENATIYDRNNRPL